MGFYTYSIADPGEDEPDSDPTFEKKLPETEIQIRP